mmetsp:Transcript_24882/g.37190  ORF Transcript_24882/g.37190 Transcript_24882/m.37190 type:complete len:81 (-) Transcript_24882:64-306(-)
MIDFKIKFCHIQLKNVNKKELPSIAIAKQTASSDWVQCVCIVLYCVAIAAQEKEIAVNMSHVHDYIVSKSMPLHVCSVST